ncbi:hypothetical protein [Bifidobacterium biavatii]|uniref:Histidine kinase n=1 Tax=Bifidobacterium biavatii DSM 23969 TaxID=1437608 RepID=A0A086ZZ33_9BIFI|nr:hypothetical protein [Bifidobacterium biavatii]KFI51783.1 hypothetical protein BBIA_0699 [Bifidobacterium biavatii DSM 23969]
MSDRITKHHVVVIDADDPRDDRTTHPHSAADHNDLRYARTVGGTDDSMRSAVTDHLAALIVATSIGLTLTFAFMALAAGAVAIPAALSIVIACALTIVAYWHPLFAGYTVTSAWAWACLVPPLAGGVTLMSLPVACCVMLATRRNARHGFMMAGAQLLMLVAGTVLGVVRPAEDFATMAVLVAIPAAPVVGLLMAWKQRLDHAREAERELEQRRRALLEQERRAAAATRIHDRVTNRLAYLILRLDNDQAEWTADTPDAARLRAELADLSGIAQGVLDETRNVIGILDGSRSPVTELTPIRPGKPSCCAIIFARPLTVSKRSDSSWTPIVPVRCRNATTWMRSTYCTISSTKPATTSSNTRSRTPTAASTSCSTAGRRH